MNGRTIVAAALVASLATAAAPTLVGAATSFTDVIVRNDDSRPVPTRAVGMTRVAGLPRPFQITWDLHLSAADSQECSPNLPLHEGRTYVIRRVTASTSHTPAGSGAEVSVGSSYRGDGFLSALPVLVVPIPSDGYLANRETEFVVTPGQETVHGPGYRLSLCARKTVSIPLGFEIAVAGVVY
jgi:hypothetical protein